MATIVANIVLSVEGIKPDTDMDFAMDCLDEWINKAEKIPIKVFDPEQDRTIKLTVSIPSVERIILP